MKKFSEDRGSNLAALIAFYAFFSLFPLLLAFVSVLGYVLEGQLRFAIDNQPERVVRAGGTFFEPIGALHSTNSATSDAPARFLAFLVVPKGAPLVVGVAGRTAPVGYPLVAGERGSEAATP